MTPGHTYHVAISVRGYLRRACESRAKWAPPGIVSTETGKRLTRLEFIDALMDLLAEGNERLPIGAPCEGWDPKTGCPGHPTKEAADAA